MNAVTRVNMALERYLPSQNIEPKRLHQAMRYSVLNGGKRLRPALVYATGATLSVNPEKLDTMACAVELIHAYSLIHDDLPAMDDDDLRRGMPTCHKAFDEATAILAGDALQVLAFQLLADADNTLFTPEQKIKMISLLASACGSIGMAGGQAMDLDLIAARQTDSLTVEELETIHRYKTGYLIRASVQLAILASETQQAESLMYLTEYADAIGLAYQIQDDIFDLEEGAEQKAAYPQLVGLDAAKTRVLALYTQAINQLAYFGQQADPLRQLADYIIHRNH